MNGTNLLIYVYYIRKKNRMRTEMYCVETWGWRRSYWISHNTIMYERWTWTSTTCNIVILNLKKTPTIEENERLHEEYTWKKK